MKLQNLLVSLRGEESVPAASKRIGLSPNYYRNLEKGYDPHRGNQVTPSPTTLKKIARAFKVDYMLLVEAAGYENDPKYNPAVATIPFHDKPVLQEWYNSLPNEDIEEVTKLYGIWKVLKGRGFNVL